MAAETQYTANTGMQTINTANSNLDGSGTLSNSIITGASNGTLIKTVTVKAIVNTTQGMVRLFLYDGTNAKLILEIDVAAVVKTSEAAAFEAIIPFNFFLKSGWSLKASTENAETFNVIAEGIDWTYYASSVRSDTTKNTAYTGAKTMNTANPNLDGTGDWGTVMVANASSKGINIQSITVKAVENTTDGMIRLYIYDGANMKLWREIPVRATTRSANARSFEKSLRFPDGFALKAGWHIRVSTEKGETFHITGDALEWNYPS